MKKSNPDAPQQTSAPRKVKDRSAGQVGASILRTVGKGIFTVLAIVLVTVIVVGVAFLLFLYSMRNEKISDDLMTSFQQSFSSTIYINGTGPESPEATSIVELQSGPERVWVDYEDIPQAMKDAVVAIEDKRFWQHKGVDWQRTVGAVLNLFSSDGQNYGGSTITQQLIKNLTGDDDVSITRKVKEIFRALNLEKEYSKEEILEAYLNCVSFGSNTIGVQAAANLYFGKDISDCDVAECAAIAGITQNPSRYNPLIHADNNRERQQLVLSEMYDQGLISESDYNQAMEESNHMTFVGKEGGSQNSIWDWYTDAVISDVQDALMEKYNCSASAASTMIYTNGLQIYSAVDQDLQDAAENYVLNEANFGSDDRMETGVAVVGYDGRVLALVGGRSEKTANRINSFATTLPQQTGSSNKPIGVYAPSLEAGIITYSSLVEDEPFAGYYGEGSDRLGPLNYSLDNLGGTYHGMVPAQKALAGSYNAAAVQTLRKLGVENSFQFLTQKLGFSSQYVDSDCALAPLALGGLTNGVTVESMAAAYAIFGNGGQYYTPYTFYKVLDHDGNVILDNTTQTPTQALSPVNASIMNRMLRTVVTEGTATGAAIPGWDVVGKTGTSNDFRDSWFIGCTPYAVCAVWTGYEDESVDMGPRDYSKGIFRGIMTDYLADKEDLDFTFDDSMVERAYCVNSGLLAGPGCTNTETGYYDINNLPETCSGYHGGVVPNTSSHTSSERLPQSSESSEPGTVSEPAESEPQTVESQSPESIPAASEPEPEPPQGSLPNEEPAVSDAA